MVAIKKTSANLLNKRGFVCPFSNLERLMNPQRKQEVAKSCVLFITKISHRY